MRCFALLILTYPILAAGSPPAGFPFGDEALSYNIVWPSGLNLGEAKLNATRAGTDWNFSLSIEASVPGYVVGDLYRSHVTQSLCSTEFLRQTLHGTKKTNETTTIAGGMATRKTAGGGGKTDIPVAACAHDALAALFFARRELGQGTVPPPEAVLFGNAYKLQLQYTGAQTIPIHDVPTQSDRVHCTVTVRENQKYEFEVYFARDAARTPLLIRAPFALGAISMELIR